MDTVEMPCAECGAVNRIPKARLAEEPRCGRCKHGLLPGAPIESNEQRFRAEVESSPVPVLVDFWAPWCGPCRAVAPVLAAIAQERKGQLKIVKVNVDEERELAMAYGIQSIPTLLIYKNGEVVNKAIGVRDGATLKRAVGLA